MSWPAKFGQGRLGMAVLGKFRSGEVSSVKVWQARLGRVSSVGVRSGVARQASILSKTRRL